MKKKRQALLAMAAAVAATTLFSQSLSVRASETEYEIYPVPQSAAYESGSYMLSDQINVVYESGIDADTKARLQEVVEKAGVTVTEGTTIDDTRTTILVGIKGDADTKVDALADYTLGNSELFSKTDSYLLESDDNVITVLGKNTDAAFYGLTTLYHIVDQLENKTIRNFQIEDYADIVSRGFIEGYYGNPWSKEDRIRLMEWGGYYKLNSYFYAPKNDPKHNADWRSLYTDAEINDLIKPLAEAGNRSKCRFVYALHPYMHNAIRHNTEENYQNDLKIMQDKFEQVIEAGVRQIAILADDAANVGGDNYTRMLEDMTDWIVTMQQTYPDLKLELPFVTQEYMYNGESYFNNFPENIQIVMTGGRIWGEVSQSFTNTFTTNAGRGPYLWINWPCTDNSKKHLIMGGYSNFLHPNVDPDKIEGIVLNPMQQSEPSKVAIFGNAAYCWNIWDSAEAAQAIWEDSFKYVDGNSTKETEASNALKELSKHMINQAMDSRVVALQESVDLKDSLTAFKNKLSNNTAITDEEIQALRTEFETLQTAAQTYKNEAGDTNLRDQIIYWLDCWEDTTNAALSYLEAVKNFYEDDMDLLVSNYIAGQAAFAASQKHNFWYLDHDEYAEVGVQHIVPFLKALDTWVGKKALEAVDPSVVTYTYISNAYNTPYAGTPELVFDGNDDTAMEFHDPNYVLTDQYIGVQFNSPITLNSVRFALAGGKNHFYYSKLEYQEDGSEEWKALTSEEYHRPQGNTDPITASGLSLSNVKAVRLRATRDNGVDSWLAIRSIDINKKEPAAAAVPLTLTGVSKSDNIVIADKNLNNVIDRNLTTEVWLKNTSGDNIPADASVTVDLGETKSIGSVYVAQDTARSNGSDILSNAVIEYSTDNTTWTHYADLTARNEQTLVAPADARYIRVRNTQQKNVWWRLSEIQVFSAEDSPLSSAASLINLRIGNHNTINDNNRNNKLLYLTDGDAETLAWLAGTDNGNIPTGGGVELRLSKPTDISGIRLQQGKGSTDVVTSLKASYKDAQGTWQDLETRTDAGDNVLFSFSPITASAIRIVNNGPATGAWWKLYELSVIPYNIDEGSVVYGNTVEAAAFSGTVSSDGAVLSNGNITLAHGEYIGLDTKSIHRLEQISVEGSGVEDLWLEISSDGLTWSSVQTGAQTRSARYVRLYNDGADDVALSLTDFQLTFRVIGTLGELISSDIPVVASWGDDRNNLNAFDGDMGTKQKFGGSPVAGNTIVYSLGQEIDIRSLRIYTVDSTEDYIRDARVELSADGLQWQEAFTIGDGTADAAGSNTMTGLGLGHVDSNYPNIRYYGADDINQKARFLRLTITANFPSRALIINEIVINGGAYIPDQSNPAFSGFPEEAGHSPVFMLDQDLTTTFKPAANIGSIGGYFTYTIDKLGILSMRIVQSGTISNASVKARLVDAANQVSIVSLGQLSGIINDFQIPAGKELTAVTIEWTEPLPEIAELIFTRDEQAPTAPSAVTTTYLQDREATLSWTAATDNRSVASYRIYDGETLAGIASGSHQDIILRHLTPATAYTLTVYAYDHAGNRSEGAEVSFTTLAEGETPDLIAQKRAELSNLAAEAEDTIASNAHSDTYTEDSIAVLQEALDTAEALLEQENVSMEALSAAIADLSAALEALEEKTPGDEPEPDVPDILQQLMDLVEQAMNELEAETHTASSAIAVQTAMKKAENLIQNNSTDETQLQTVFTELDQAIADLTILPDRPWIFEDVKVQPGNWKYDGIKFVYDNAIMEQITNTLDFQPDRHLDRAMFATVLWRMAGKPQVSYSNTFSDVPDGKWYSTAIIWANKNGIVSGIGNGKYGTSDNVTRAQIAKMLYEYADKVCKYDVSEKQSLASFTDVKEVKSWAVPYLEWATAVKMISGKPNDAQNSSYRLDGEGPATRAECAVMMKRFADKYIP